MNTCRVCKEIKENSEFIMRGTQTATCIECSKTRKSRDYCIHNRRAHDCYMCQDVLVRRTTSMITGSRIADKKKGRICNLDFQTVLDKICDTPNCTYCSISLQYTNPYLDDFATCDRISDDLGHLNSNTVVACRKCNCSQRKFLQPNYWNIVNGLKEIKG